MNLQNLAEYRHRIRRGMNIDKIVVDRNLNQSNSLLSEKLIATLARLPAGSRVLEVGSGMEKTLQEIKQRFPHLKASGTNYDFSGPQHGTVNAEASELPFKTSKFDFVFSVQTWQYVPRKAEFLHEVHRLLKPGGIALIHAPTRGQHSDFVIHTGRQKIDGFKQIEKHPDVEVEAPAFDERIITVKKSTRSLKLPLKFSLKKSMIGFRFTDGSLHFVSAYDLKRKEN